VGGDISMLPKYEQYNSPYKDAYNQNIDNLLTWFMEDCGWNTFRVRIFVNPIQKAKGTSDPSVCQDLAYVTTLGQRIKQAGGYFMLDFHYSDEWVDATHIQAPVAWQGCSDAAMADSVGEYTKQVLQTLNDSNATPDLVQVGNEIMYGLCGIVVHPYDKSGDDWDGYLGLLHAGCNAVREKCPNAQIIIHTDRPTNRSYNFYYYNKLIQNEVDFDVIGLSYYPFWHGYLTVEQVASKSDKNNLVSALETLHTQFPEKAIQIVECAYNFQWWPSSGVNYDTRDVWACDAKGQYNFVKDLVDALKPLEYVDGINYWFPEEAGNGDRGTVISSWLNRGFWNEDKTTAGHQINRTVNGYANIYVPAKNICAPYYMGTFAEQEEQGIDDLSETGKTRIEKVLIDGQLYIKNNENTYSIIGQKR